jgi:hypothetical protein
MGFGPEYQPLEERLMPKIAKKNNYKEKSGRWDL